MDRRVQYAAGIACICFVAVIWTAATVLKQIIFQNMHFGQPLIVTFVCNSCYMAHLPFFALGRGLGLVRKLPWSSPRPEAEGDEATATVAEAVRVGAAVAPFWFAAQWTYNSGIVTTSVTSSTVISATSAVWTLLASVLFLGERLTILKVAGIAACVAGNVAVTAQRNGSPQQWGDVFCIVSAMIYAVYTTMLKRFSNPNTSVMLLFGSIGVIIFATIAPITFWLNWRDWRHLMSWKIFGLLVFNGFFDNVLSQYAWAKAVHWTSPTAATVGLSLTIPLSILADCLRGTAVPAPSFLAAALVTLGFVLVALAPGLPEPVAAQRDWPDAVVALAEEDQLSTPPPGPRC